jgi:hypothetical protein
MQIRVRGIDADGEPQDMTVDGTDMIFVDILGWKYALLEDGSERAGELSLSLAERRRTWR